MTFTVDFRGLNTGVQAITSNALSVLTGDVITIALVLESFGASGWTVTNTGTAISWAQVAEIGTGSGCQITLWKGIAGATPPTTVTVTETSNSGHHRALFTSIHTGAHAITPVPAGKVFSGAGTTDVSQSITPTSPGSCLWLVCGDFNATNTFAAAANCTLAVAAYHEASRFTAVPVQPTTQPRTDILAFTIGETDTAGSINFIAWEVQAAGAGFQFNNSGTRPAKFKPGLAR